MNDQRLTSKLLGALLLSASALHAAPASAAPASVSSTVVPNGGFEVAGGASSVPAFWTAKGPGKVTASSESKAEGARGLLIESPQGGGETSVESGELRLSVGQLYRLSAWVRTKGVQADPQARYPTALGACLAMKSFPFTNCAPAQGVDAGSRVSVLFFATQSTDRVQLHLGRNGKATGSVWYDDVRLEKVDDITQYVPMESVRWAGKGFRYDDGGWIYVHVEGEPYERGQQFGQLVSGEIVRYIEKLGIQKDKADAAKGWAHQRLLADSLFLRKFDAEYLEEMKGIADGANKAGAKFKDRDLDLLDIVTLNTAVDAGQLEEANRATSTSLSGRTFLKADDEAERGGKGDHCSSFVATKSATPDGRAIIGQIFMWSGYTGVHWDVILDVQPTKGHRVVMQTFPGGIHSGADWFINSAGIVIGETTVGQTPFDLNGTPQSNRIRKAAQYASSIDDVARIMKENNNGLYTNDWTLADTKTDEGACLLLGTKKTRLWRTGSKGNAADTPGNLKDFIWANNNNRDLEVRKESVSNPDNAPADLAFNTWNRDIAFQEYYARHAKKGFDLDAAIRMMASSPINRPHACDGKVTTSEMAEKMMFLAHYGKTTLREKMIGSRFMPDLPGATPHLSLGYTTFSPLFVADKLKEARKTWKAPEEPAAPKRDLAKVKEAVTFDAKLLWANTLFPASDAENWLVSGTSAYWKLLKDVAAHEDKLDKAFEQQRDVLADLNDRYLFVSSREADVAPAAAKTDYGRYGTYLVPRIKGTFALHQLRLLLGNADFSKVMNAVHSRYANKDVTTADFKRVAQEVSGKDVGAFVGQWLERTGLPQPRFRATASQVKDGYEVTLKVEQPGGKPWHFVTLVEVRTAKGSTFERVEVKGASESVTLRSAEAPVRVVFNAGNDVPVAREKFQVLANQTDAWEKLLMVHGTARQTESMRTLVLGYRELLADVFTERLVPVAPDSEVTDAVLADRDLVVFGGAEDNALLTRLAEEKKLPVELGRRYFRWQGKTYGRPDDGIALALPNPWNPKRSMYLFVANSGIQLWQMTRTYQRNLQGWALFRGGDVTTKGFHDLDALSQDVVVTPAPAAPAQPPAPAPAAPVPAPVLGMR
ncbi:C45 family autoproteolytic acyltransferase/hydrolase [Myxococcus sp. K15C18031901]|uniref:C45 family autoproteolytic acyltransferase/hydolase n=1 Tax=Myxococcus dinghuensis TaxID=2906761 RepID=UPI0020A746C7|nr:C45 family autoproteolytic acyltransferase/hydolase [Myxococcus dinghuensis]MCP3102806.1 C45 family autoproteolytic acyltransferase/hydrolase [Myxococcus dinghuensis]